MRCLILILILFFRSERVLKIGQGLAELEAIIFETRSRVAYNVVWYIRRCRLIKLFVI